MASKPDLTEVGTTGLRRTSGTIWEEFLVNLRGLKGTRVYREMADNDPHYWWDVVCSRKNHYSSGLAR